MMNIQRPLSSHFHQLIRPSLNGSCASLEDNIVVPTPRKVRNMNNSPLPKRKNTQENVLFGEAGQELHTILFQGSDSSDNENSEEEILEIIEMRNKHQGNSSTNTSSYHHHEAKYPRFESSPPVRSSNPITLNSPFYHENALQLEILPQMRIVNSRPSNGNNNIAFENGTSCSGSYESNSAVRRYRSSSWPVVSKLVTSE